MHAEANQTNFYANLFWRHVKRVANIASTISHLFSIFYNKRASNTQIANFQAIFFNKQNIIWLQST